MNDKLILIIFVTTLMIISGCVTYDYEGVVNGTVNINGSAFSSNIKNYTIEIGSGNNPKNWTRLGVVLTDDGTSNINESILAIWNTSHVSDGEYTVRLTVTDSNGVSSQDLVYVIVDNVRTPTRPCPSWSCSNLVEGPNSVDIQLTQEQYGSDMNCSITCQCPENMHMGIYSEGDIEYYYDFLYLDEASHTGYWSGFDSGFNDTVDMSFVSDYSVDGSSGYGGFNITNITCAPYCLSSSSYYGYEYISRVWLNNVGKSSSGSSYSDYTGSVFTTLIPGKSYTLDVNVKTTGNYIEYVKAWIDFNHDYDFTDTGEEINLSSYAFYGTHNFSKSFAVPSDAVLGNTRMRVSAKYASVPSPCEAYSYGEVEDYTIEINDSMKTTTTTIQEECDLVGDNPPCGEVTLSEVISLINIWAQGQAQLSDVIALITAWASG